MTLQIVSLDPSIGTLRELEELDLRSNQQMASLPTKIGLLSNLKRLDLYRNRLKTLPSQIGELRNLVFLDLRHNLLTVELLPSELGIQILLSQHLPLNSSICLKIITRNFVLFFMLFFGVLSGRLQQLKKILLSNNKLTALPPEICGLKGLTELDVSNNQLNELLNEIGELHALTQYTHTHTHTHTHKHKHKHKFTLSLNFSCLGVIVS
jgi:Leucine-rich repeat (LRR) protein